MQKRILAGVLAAADGRIQVLPPQGRDEGEVRTGTWRAYGPAATEAVEALLKAGLIEHKNDGTLALTENGLLAATALDAEPSG
jgi:hypothetical protein